MPTTPDAANDEKAATASPPRRVPSLSVSPSLKRILFAYFCCCCFRVANVTLIQSYFDPDEFWQTLEPAYCTVFYQHDKEKCPGYTWEWKRRASPPLEMTAAVVQDDTCDTTTPNGSASTCGLSKLSFLQRLLQSWFNGVKDWIVACMQGPVRTHLSVLPTALFYYVVRRLGVDTHWMVARGPMILNALTVAAPIDTAIWWIASCFSASATASVTASVTATSTAAAAASATTSKSAATASRSESSHWQGDHRPDDPASNDWSTERDDFPPFWCLFCSITSWFHAYTLVRSFANGQESLLLIAALALVWPELQTEGRASKDSNNLSLVPARACMAFYLGGCSTAIRSTAVVAFVVLGHVLALRYSRYRHNNRPVSGGGGSSSNNTSRLACLLDYCSYLCFPCATCGLAGIGTAVVVDYIGYGGLWTLPLLANVHFNVVMNAAQLYGTHPWHWYMTAGIPAVTGLLLPFGLYDFYCQLSSSQSSSTSAKANEIRQVLWWIIVVYVGALTMNAHKEFRFILPILPPWCLLSARHVCDAFDWLGRCRGQGRHYGRYLQGTVATVWLVANLIAVLYLGLFHQSGPISVNREVVRLDNEWRFSNGTTTHYYHDERRKQRTNAKTASSKIHYLTGDCHSTPWHSHLHRRQQSQVERDDSKTAGETSLAFNTWHLDCSPQCRNPSNNNVCESTRFAMDPIAFLEDEYCLVMSSRRRRKRRSGRSCQPRHSPPDYVVTFSSYANNDTFRQLLANAFDLVPVACFPHTLTGIEATSALPLDEGFLASGNDWFYVWNTRTKCGQRTWRFRTVYLSLVVHMDEVVLFARDHSRMTTDVEYRYL